MTAMLGTTGTCQIGLRRLRGVVYVNVCGQFDDRAMTALMQVATPLLTGTSFRRMIVDLCDVRDADVIPPARLAPLRLLAESHGRQLAVIIPTTGDDELADARRRRRPHRPADAAGPEPYRSCRRELQAS